MPEALLCDKLPGQRVRCNVCQWRCEINPGKSGVCRVRRNENGTLRLLNYGRKKAPLSFFPRHPGTLTGNNRLQFSL